MRSLIPCLLVASLVCQVVPTTSSAMPPSFPEYDIQIDVADSQKSIEVHGEIRLSAPNEDREEIQFMLAESFGTPEVEVLAPAAALGAELVAGRFEDGYSEGWGTQAWVLRSSVPFPAGEPIVVSFRCRGEEGSAFVYHLGEPVSFAGGINTAWYLQVANSETEDLDGLPATGTLVYNVPDDLSVYSAGTRAEIGPGQTRFDVESPVMFSFGIGRYTVISEGTDPVVSGYFLQEREHNAGYVSGSTAVLDVLRSAFGPYPHSEFAIVEVPTNDASDAGFAGASLNGFMMASTSFLSRRFNTAYFGHEVGHQWWGNLLAPSQERGGMIMSEGLAQFGALLSVDAIDGPEMAERFRRTGYPGFYGDFSAVGYMTLVQAGMDKPASEANHDGAARIIADAKGFQVWNMLADQVGPDRLRVTMADLVKRRSFDVFTWDEFLDDLESGLGEDLGWFWDQWFERTGLPNYHMEWSQDSDRVDLVVRQVEPTFRARMEVDFRFSDGSTETHIIEVDGEETRVRIGVSGLIETVELDPRYRVLRSTAEYLEIADSLGDPVRGRLLYWGGEPDSAKIILEGVLEDPTPDIDAHGRRFAAHAVLGQVLFAQEDYQGAREHLMAALHAPSRRAEELPSVYLFLGKVALAMEDDELLAMCRSNIGTADALAGDTGARAELEELIETR